MTIGEKLVPHLTSEQKDVVVDWINKHPNLSVPRQIESWEREWNVCRKALEDVAVKAIYN